MNPDGSPRFVTVNGSSAAAATVAGAAALLAQARPSLGADALARAARRHRRGSSIGDPVTAQGAGLVDVGAAAAGEVAASPATLALGRSTRRRLARQGVVHADEPLDAPAAPRRSRVRTQDEGAAAVDFTVRPRRASRCSRAGACSCTSARSPRPRRRGRATADGAVLVGVHGGGGIRVPWAIAFGPDERRPDRRRRRSPSKSFAASDTKPALLAVDAGRVVSVAGHPEIRPLQRLDVVLWRADGTQVGTLARLRDVLPGRYTFGLTGPRPGRAAPPARRLRPPHRRATPSRAAGRARRRLPFTLADLSSRILAIR